MLSILQSKYVKSAPSISDAPYHDYAEIAFIGRSNVGKSSLINTLVNHKGLAKTSSTPGKTKLLNFFEIQTNLKPFYITDLPGYGYAKQSTKTRQEWVNMSSEYLINRPQLRHTFLLIDGRHTLQSADREFMEWANNNAIPYSCIATKFDKMNQQKSQSQKKYLLNELNGLRFPLILTSSATREGVREMLSVIEEIVNH